MDLLAETTIKPEDPEDILFSAWSYRLDIQSAQTDPEAPDPQQRENRHWRATIVTSVVVGALYALFAGGKPPVPIPGEATPLFWIGWGPLTASGILFYLAVVDRTSERTRWYGGAAIVAILAGLVTAWTAWGRTDHTTTLLALHLPFIVWAAVGSGVALGYPDAASQFYAFLVKSVETVLTAGIYLFAGLIFGGLTYGIFAVLGVVLPEDNLRTLAAWGIGAIPLLALSSVYRPASPPTEQSWETGLARILRILTRLLLPLALGVLAVYVFWFIPAYFWRPFKEREVLIVYNATIMAILVLLAFTVTGADEQRTPKQDLLLRYAILSTGFLTVLLNIYALAAILSRTVEFGFTPESPCRTRLEQHHIAHARHRPDKAVAGRTGGVDQPISRNDGPGNDTGCGMGSVGPPGPTPFLNPAKRPLQKKSPPVRGFSVSKSIRSCRPVCKCKESVDPENQTPVEFR